jgi:chalcone isomerase-like protein
MSRALSIAVSVVLFAWASCISAKECRGIDFPERVQVAGQDLALNGLGVRKATFLKVNVYVAALYVSHPAREGKSLIGSTDPQQLTLQFVRNVSKDQLTDAWREGFEKVAKEQMAALNQRIERLNSWMTDVKTGQRLTFTRTSNSIDVNVNGADKGSIEGQDFSRAFLAIWLGDAPPNPELKAGLLGGACE